MASKDRKGDNSYGAWDPTADFHSGDLECLARQTGESGLEVSSPQQIHNCETMSWILWPLGANHSILDTKRILCIFLSFEYNMPDM